MTNQELKTLPSISIIEDIMDGMLDVVGTSDMEGRITQINKAVEAWGYKKEDLIGKPVSEFIAMRSLPKLGDERKRTLEMGAVRNLELIGLRKAGSEFPVLVNVTLLRDSEGKPGGRIFAVRDITERKRVEAALLKKGVELQHQITERKRVEEVLEITERKCRDIAEFLPDLISILPKLWSHELT